MQRKRNGTFLEQFVDAYHSLIILHSGSKNGWVSDASLVFQSKKATGEMMSVVL